MPTGEAPTIETAEYNLSCGGRRATVGGERSYGAEEEGRPSYLQQREGSKDERRDKLGIRKREFNF